jgi:hypothetical protein
VHNKHLNRSGARKKKGNKKKKKKKDGRPNWHSHSLISAISLMGFKPLILSDALLKQIDRYAISIYI